MCDALLLFSATNHCECQHGSVLLRCRRELRGVCEAGQGPSAEQRREGREGRGLPCAPTEAGAPFIDSVHRKEELLFERAVATAGSSAAGS